MALSFLTGCFGWEPTRLSRLEPDFMRVWMFIINVILIIPSAIAGFKAKSYYEWTQHFPELSRLPYDEHASLAFYLTYVGCVVVFVWVFLSSFLLMIFRGKDKQWIFLHGIVNLGLAITTGLGASMEARFLPANTNSCQGMNKPENQKMDGDYIFFSLFAIITKNDVGKTEAVCKSMINDWTTATTVVFFISVLAYLTIFFDERENSLLNPIRPFFWILVLLFTPWFIVLGITNGVLPRIRLWISFVEKSISRLRSKDSIDIPLQTQFRPQWAGYHIPKTKMMNVLNIEHVLLNVVEHMHHEDVVNLSLACRAMREAIYPSNDLQYRLPKLHKYCCSIATSFNCLYCNNKICTSCLQSPFYPGLSGRRHTKCVPYCEACYYNVFAKRNRRNPVRPCKCYSTDRGNEFQFCCRTCMTKPVEQLQAARHKRYQKECLDIAYEEGAKCTGCLKTLKPGMRWWKCTKCSGECRDKIHPGYVRKKRRDVEKGISEEDEEEELSWWRRGFRL